MKDINFATRPFIPSSFLLAMQLGIFASLLFVHVRAFKFCKCWLELTSLTKETPPKLVDICYFQSVGGSLLHFSENLDPLSKSSRSFRRYYFKP